MLREGRSGDSQVLRPGTVQEMFQPQFSKAVRPQNFPDFQGTAWYAQQVANQPIWQHSGADPGINTLALLHIPSKSAVLFFVNTAPTEHLGDVSGACLRLAAGARRHET
jgi:hypothetical protein